MGGGADAKLALCQFLRDDDKAKLQPNGRANARRRPMSNHGKKGYERESKKEKKKRSYCLIGGFLFM